MPMSQLDLPPADPVASFTACHERIRKFMAGLERMAALPSFDDPRVPDAAAQAYRYFSEGLSLHAADEDFSLAPRLLAAQPDTGPLLDDLAADHRSIEACLATLLPMLELLAAGRPVPRAAFRAAVGFLRGVLIPHIQREEIELFPRVARLDAPTQRVIAEEILHRRRA